MRIQFNSVGYFKSDLICLSWAKLDKNQKEASVFEQDSGRGIQRSHLFQDSESIKSQFSVCVSTTSDLSRH